MSLYGSTALIKINGVDEVCDCFDRDERIAILPHCNCFINSIEKCLLIEKTIFNNGLKHKTYVYRSNVLSDNLDLVTFASFLQPRSLNHVTTVSDIRIIPDEIARRLFL